MAKIAVAPLVGAWIEICEFFPSVDDYVSLPSWERGLKEPSDTISDSNTGVAPLVGAWIEIVQSDTSLQMQ